MALTLDATIGGGSANSYITLASAVSYFEGRLDVAEWTAAATATKEVALVMATSRLDVEVYVGEPAATTQALQFPRNNVPERNGSGYYYESTEMPAPVGYAQCEMALALLKDSTLASDTGLEAFTHLKVGSLDVTPRASRKAGALPAAVVRLLYGIRESVDGLATVVRG